MVTSGNARNHPSYPKPVPDVPSPTAWHLRSHYYSSMPPFLSPKAYLSLEVRGPWRVCWEECCLSRCLKLEGREFPGGPVVRTLSSHCRGAQVQSLVRELRSRKPSRQPKTKQNKTGGEKNPEDARRERKGHPQKGAGMRCPRGEPPGWGVCKEREDRPSSCPMAQAGQ